MHGKIDTSKWRAAQRVMLKAWKVFSWTVLYTALLTFVAIQIVRAILSWYQGESF